MARRLASRHDGDGEGVNWTHVLDGPITLIPVEWSAVGKHGTRYAVWRCGTRNRPWRVLVNEVPWRSVGPIKRTTRTFGSPEAAKQAVEDELERRSSDADA